MKKIIALLLLAILAYGLLGGLANKETCYEDMPCWDCRYMGNRLCGPGSEFYFPDKCGEVCDYNDNPEFTN